MLYPSDIDPEVIPLCDCINSFPGLETTYSCSGHGEYVEGDKRFHIMIRVTNIVSMQNLLWVINPQRYYNEPNQKRVCWQADAYYAPNAILVLDLYPKVSSTEEAVLAATNLIEEIQWLQSRGEFMGLLEYLCACGFDESYSIRVIKDKNLDFDCVWVTPKNLVVKAIKIDSEDKK